MRIMQVMYAFLLVTLLAVTVGSAYSTTLASATQPSKAPSTPSASSKATPVASPPSTQSAAVSASTILPPGAIVPVPVDQDVMPPKTAVAQLVGKTIHATVTISTPSFLDSPNSEAKEIVITSQGGLTDTNATAYRLYIFQGVSANGNCSSTSIGGILDPNNLLTSPKGYRCVRDNSTATCAPGDLTGKYGAFAGTKNGQVNVTWHEPSMQFQNTNADGIANRTLVLYNALNARVACGAVKLNKPTGVVSQYADSVTAASDRVVPWLASTAVFTLTTTLAALASTG